VIALVLLSLTGAAMAAADVETFVSSPVFAAKLGVVVLLLINGLVLLRTERRLERFAQEGPTVDEAHLARQRSLWRRMRATAWTSAALWALALITGVMLTNAA
jgi:hypothetical protein